MGGHSLGGACGHIKAHGLSLFPHQRKLCTEGLLGRHALGMLGRTLEEKLIMACIMGGDLHGYDATCGIFE